MNISIQVVFVSAIIAAAIALPTTKNQIVKSEQLAGGQSEYVTGKHIEEGTFTVPLDHSRPQDSRTVEFVSFFFIVTGLERSLIINHYSARTDLQLQLGFL